VVRPSAKPNTASTIEVAASCAVNHGIALTRAQMAWYQKKADTQLEDLRREFPSTPEEAFEASVEGAY
jgi:hypothetical protein